MFDFERKPHGVMEPKPEKGGYVFREPKGDPDMLFFSDDGGLDSIMKAAALLSVQGYTARIVVLNDAELFDRQPESYRKEVFPETIPAKFGYAPAEDRAKRFQAYSDHVFSGETEPGQFAKEALSEAKKIWE